MRSPDYPKARQNQIIIQELKDEILIYDLRLDKACCLNQTSAVIYQLCDGTNSVAELRRKATQRLRSPVTEDLIWLAIDELKKENLLENSPQITGKFEGLSRREAIKKVGLASMVALPLITSLVAPTAAMAQSAAAACIPAGTQATTTAPNNNGSGLLDCLAAASQKCCNVPPFAFQSTGPNICDAFTAAAPMIANKTETEAVREGGIFNVIIN